MKLFSDPIPEYHILPHYLPVRTKRRSGLLIKDGVRFVVAHDTGNPNSTANGNVRYYDRTHNEKSASAHIFVDDRQIIECIPALTGKPEKAWHVRNSRQEDNILYGCDANDAAIGVEYCYGSNINADEAYRKYVWVLAFICWKFKLDPTKSIVGHSFLDPVRKTDPITGLAHSRRSYPQLLKDVVAMYNAGTGVAPPTIASTGTAASAALMAKALLNIRKSEPFRRAVLSRQVHADTALKGIRLVTGEPVNGNDQWYDLGNNEFCWSGGVGVVI